MIIEKALPWPEVKIKAGIPVMVKAGDTARIQIDQQFGKSNFLTGIPDSERLWFSQVEMLVNIFNRYRGFIHQYTDRQRQTTQRHDIDGLTKQVKK